MRLIDLLLKSSQLLGAHLFSLPYCRIFLAFDDLGEGVGSCHGNTMQGPGHGDALLHERR